jgi:integrase
MLAETVAKSSKQDALGSKPVARKFNFTKKLVASLPLPTNGQRAYYYDTATRGLALAVSPAGKRVFLLYRKVEGRPERITIGPFPDLSIEQARGKAAELNGAIARGENPASKRRLVRDAATLGELFLTYLEHHAKPHKKTWAEDEEMFRNHLHALKLRRISHIRKTDIVELHLRVGRNSGEYMANRVLQLLRGVFNKAIEWGWNGENPASRIKAFKEHKRERFLQPDELPAFFRAVAQEPNETIRDYVLLSLLTGARRSNVQAMRWSEINWAATTWRIPETKSKSGEAITVALPRQAIEILERRRQESEGGEWVFPGRGVTGHLVEPKAAWAGILKHAGIEDLRLHDLRRTLGSWQAATGASLPVIGKSLGHKSLAATQVYARLNLDPVRASVNKATDAMLDAANGEAGLLGDGK